MTKMLPPKQVILYVDDDGDDLDLVRDAMDKYASNIELVTAYDGYEALSYLQRISFADLTPCLIILDLNMPRMNGRELLEKIRSIERFEETPAVIFTTSSSPEDKHFASHYNAGFITKPIDFTQLAEVAQELVGHCAEETQKNIQRREHNS